MLDDKLVEGKCQTSVITPGMRGMFTHQCTRKVWKDGFCKLHHPETVAIREVKKTEAYNERQKHSAWGLVLSYKEKLDVANVRIAELEAQLQARNEADAGASI